MERFQEVCQETLPSKMLLWTFKIARSLATSPAKCSNRIFTILSLKFWRSQFTFPKWENKNMSVWLLNELEIDFTLFWFIQQLIGFYLGHKLAANDMAFCKQTINVWWILLIYVFQFFYTELLERITFFEETSQSNWEIPIYYEMTQKWNFCQSNLFPR